MSRRSLGEGSGGGNKSLQTSHSRGGGGGGISCRSSGMVRKRSPSLGKKIPSSSSPTPARDDKMMNGCSSMLQQQQHQEAEEEEEAMGDNVGVDGKRASVSASPRPSVVNNDDTISNNKNITSKMSKMVVVGGEKTIGDGGGVEVNEWPRIYIPLTRKEKEEDFMAIKGTKLPHRPKKRPKAVDRILQYCYPGMWLSDLSRSRYEVREKKSTAKKPKRRGGLKGMESDSE